jgi:hypothetical protein
VVLPLPKFFDVKNSMLLSVPKTRKGKERTVVMVESFILVYAVCKTEPTSGASVFILEVE